MRKLPQRKSSTLLRLFRMPKRQRLGTSVLVVGVAFVVCLKIFWPPTSSASLGQMEENYKAEIDKFYAGLTENREKHSAANRKKQEAAIREKYDKLKLFKFDPNTISTEGFQQLGLSERQARIIDNYRSKGGTFRSKADFSKMYGISAAQFGFLKPYITLPDEYIAKNNFEQKEKFPQKKPIELFDFDPNTANLDELHRLGFSEKQAQVIDNFRQKTQFREKKDFAELFVVSEKHFAQLEPHIKIVDKPEIVEKKEEVIAIDLNLATAEELTQIRGIGKYSAKRIIDYRERLGGFRNNQQLFEIPKLRKTTIEQMLPLVFASEKDIRIIRLNGTLPDNLNQHPYIGYHTAEKIVEHRETLGFFKSVDQLLELKYVTKSKFKKLKPYLRLQ